MIVFWILFLSALAILVLSLCCYFIGFFSPIIIGQNNPRVIPAIGAYKKHYPAMIRLIDKMEMRSYEKVYIASEDRKRLFGRFYDTGSSTVQLMLHGYRGCAQRDFCGGFELGSSTGFSSLLVDQRACGKSQGHTVTMGVKEAQDAMLWINWIIQRKGPDSRILLYGVSMGAATALMCLSLRPRNLIGVVADCPYSSPKAIVRKVSRDYWLIPSLAYPAARLGALVFGRFDLEASSALEAVRHTDVPILFIHGKADDFVPCSMSEELYRECSSMNKRILTVEGAGHGLSYMEDGPAYHKAVLDFIESLGCKISKQGSGDLA